jgi:hypothetical protein
MQYKTLYNNNILHALEGTCLRGAIYQALLSAGEYELQILESKSVEQYDEALEELDDLAYDLSQALSTEISYQL